MCMVRPSTVSVKLSRGVHKHAELGGLGYGPPAKFEISSLRDCF